MSRKVLLGNVVEQRAANVDGAAGERHFDLAFLPDFSHLIPEQAGDMRRVEGRSDRHYGARHGDAMSGGKHCRTAETVPDQDGRRGKRVPQMIGSGHQVIHVRRKRGVGEFAFAGRPGR